MMTEMTEEEALIADSIYEAIQRRSNRSARSRQAQEFQVGVSDLGFCSERTRRMLDHQVPLDTDVLAAFIGTAIGDHAEQAIADLWPEAIIQAEMTVDLVGDMREYRLGGHPDVVMPDGLVIDFKTDYGLSTVERTGPSQQQQFQRNLYGLGCHQSGLFDPEVTLEDVRVGNAWIDRAAIDKRVHVNIEPLNMEVIQAATEWLEDVVYAYLHQEEARKEPPRDMCAVICGFYETCRQYDTDVEGLITDPVVLAAVDMYVEGADSERMGKRLKDEAKRHLDGVRGSTGSHTVRWTTISPSEVNFVRAGYDKLEVRPIKRGRKA